MPGYFPGRFIEDLTWPEVAEAFKADVPVIVPIGAASKEHGHHLPMKTDWLLARALAEGIAARLPVLIAPIVPFGYYPVFQSYPGSQHLSADTFVRLLTELLDRLLDQGARRLAILNTGVSTEGPIGLATRGILERRGVRDRRRRLSAGWGAPPTICWSRKPAATPTNARPRSCWRSRRSWCGWIWRSATMAGNRLPACS